MAQVNEKDINAIKDWLAKEPYLPKHMDDIALRKFLFSCNNSLERTKRCIEEFCTTRAYMTEVFCDRDPLSPKLQKAFANTCVTTYLAGVDEILIHKLTSTENFEFYDLIKSFMLQADQWIRLERDTLPENHIIVLDIKEYTLAIISKSNIFYFQKFLIFLLQGMPVRLKQVHVVNCPSYIDYLYGLVKGALPQDIRDLIKFHTDHNGLHQHIDKKYLPSDYGGEAEEMIKQSLKWIEDIKALRKTYLDDTIWKADLSKKAKNGTVDTAMSGSFRALAID
ncbi:alpha-tocopherol transfer protein-like [Trichoplusia ni]|uniref:Alpha-tocopherol transfer protein-like n=1 Tax=Trichoplusia ni TaxID=7111 RepID=A0A7E5WJL1_TRINI|nr:alpha-tocopherol transfer protein-like [Trichoplusia ni]XP_026740974.1 alpha-tocopherol transfer protein-like [Trichoplusia ni]XP_026740975.1 alpha-tocopherol transfer protein-like [Trichoplusia ni]